MLRIAQRMPTPLAALQQRTEMVQCNIGSNLTHI
jgi:hypothetical protein